jgi:hypothetical protein
MPKDLRKFIQNYKFFNVKPFVSGLYGPPNVVLSFPQPPMTGPVTEDVGEYFAVCDTCNDRAGTYRGRMPWNCGIQEATKYWGHDVQPLLRASQNGYINSESLI